MSEHTLASDRYEVYCACHGRLTTLAEETKACQAADDLVEDGHRMVHVWDTVQDRIVV